MNIIPDNHPQTNNYWCTWDTQWNVLKETLPDGREIPTRDAMCEEFLFGNRGVLNGFQGLREDLIALLDDGWDVPFGAQDTRLFGTLDVDGARFPSLRGTPEEKLCALSDRVRRMGYRGLGLWVPSQAPGERAAGGACQDLKRDRARCRWRRCRAFFRIVCMLRRRHRFG